MLKQAVVVAVVGLLLSGCASATPPRPTLPSFGHVRHLAVVVSGDSQFTVVDESAEPGRTFERILSWPLLGPSRWLRPIADLVHRGLNWLLETDRTASAAVDLGAASPRSLVAAAFTQALEDSGRFEGVRTYAREPVGEDRRRTDAIVRVTVPAWGLVRVQAGEPALLSAFADVRAEMVLPASGVVVWSDSQDVTDPERLPLRSFTGDREFTRQQLIGVLERAGQRLASELLYAQGGGR